MNDATTSNIPTNIADSTPASSAAPVSPASKAAPTPGWQTSEFWLTALAQIGLALGATTGVLPANYAVIAGAVGQAAYSISRGVVKSRAASAPVTTLAAA